MVAVSSLTMLNVDVSEVGKQQHGFASLLKCLRRLRGLFVRALIISNTAQTGFTAVRLFKTFSPLEFS